METPVTFAPDRPGEWGAPTSSLGEYQTAEAVMADGAKIFYRFWRQPQDIAPVLVLLHGLGAHSGWFIDMANSLHARGLSVYIMDHRGFGRSGGPRGHVRRGRVFLDDTKALLEMIRVRHSGAPLFVLGHSMGGIFAVHLAEELGRQSPRALQGIILMNPWVKDRGSVGGIAQLRIALMGMARSPRLWRVAGGPEVMTTSREAIAMLNADPYWVRAQSAAFLYQVTLLRSTILRRARQVQVPALVLQSGHDLAVVPEASRKCFDTLGCKDKRWIVYPEYSHDCEFESNREQLDTDIAAWIQEHLSS